MWWAAFTSLCGNVLLKAEKLLHQTGLQLVKTFQWFTCRRYLGSQQTCILTQHYLANTVFVLVTGDFFACVLLWVYVEHMETTLIVTDAF